MSSAMCYVKYLIGGYSAKDFSKKSPPKKSFLTHVTGKPSGMFLRVMLYLNHRTSKET